MPTKKPYRINGKDVVVKAENALYNGAVAGAADAQAAIDAVNTRVVALENASPGEGGVHVLPYSDNDGNPYNIKRVFFKSDYAGKSNNWDLAFNDYTADEALSISANQSFTLTVELWGGSVIGADAITAKSIGLQGMSNFSNTSKVYSYDGVKEIITFTGFWTPAGYAGKKSVLSGSFYISVAGATNGIHVTSYVTYGDKKFHCKRCVYSPDSNVSGSSNVSLDYDREWEKAIVEPQKVEVLSKNIIRIGGFGSSEYDPFIIPTTTPRVLCTICSDDGEVRDYTMLRPYFAAKAEEAGVPIRWSVAIIPALTQWMQSKIPYGTGNQYMTAEMIRDLVTNYGVSVLCHNWNHEYLNLNTDYQTLDAQVNLFKKAKAFIERGIGVQCIHHCLPGGGYNANTWDALDRVFLDTATINEGINTAATNPKKIYRNDVYGLTSTQLIEKLTDAATYVTNNNKSAWVCYYTHGHEIGTPSNPNSRFEKVQAITEYCLTNGIAMVNYSEAYAEIYPPLERLKDLLGLNS